MTNQPAPTHSQNVVSSEEVETRRFLAMVGNRVFEKRNNAGMSRRVLSEKSGVSPRYLAQLESGQGNISIGLLNRVSLAFGCDVAELVSDRGGREFTSDRKNRIALVGLRGAGKSTLGRLAAERLGLNFLELNDEIEARCGMPMNEIFSLYGQDGYRRLESEALYQITADHSELVLAVAGGIVSEPRTYDYLLANYQTIWLKARPEEHMNRVRGQGDERPMTGAQDAMADLQRILRDREVHYARADAMVDTSGADIEQSLVMLLQHTRDRQDEQSKRNICGHIST